VLVALDALGGDRPFSKTRRFEGTFRLLE